MYENDGGLLSPRDAYRLMLKDYPDVMDIGQMCEALGVSTKTGYKLLKDGKIEYLKIGRAYRIPKAHILRYLKNHLLHFCGVAGYGVDLHRIDAES